MAGQRHTGLLHEGPGLVGSVNLLRDGHDVSCAIPQLRFHADAGGKATSTFFVIATFSSKGRCEPSIMTEVNPCLMH